MAEPREIAERALLDDVRRVRREELAPERLGQLVLERLQEEMQLDARQGRDVDSRDGGGFSRFGPFAGPWPPRLAGAGVVAALVMGAFLLGRRSATPSFVAWVPEPSKQDEADGAELRRAERAATSDGEQHREPHETPVGPSKSLAANPLAESRSEPRPSGAGVEPGADALPAGEPPARPLPPYGPVYLRAFPVTHHASPGAYPAAFGAAGGRNLLSNGDFSQGEAMWSVREWQDMTSFGSIPYYVVAGALCTRVRGGQHAVGGWPWDDHSLKPDHVELEAGRRYGFSVKAWVKGSLPVQLLFKLGHQSAPNQSMLGMMVPVSAAVQSYGVEFTAPRDDDRAGVAFVLSTAPGAGQTELCVDDVTLLAL
jgi:hypothetical protein